MKRFLLICAVAMLVYACDKETNVVYDTHLFQQLRSSNWILDSERITDSSGIESARFAVDTVDEITQFNSQQYTVRIVKKGDTTAMDSASYPIIYDNPKRMYFYDEVSQQIIRNQYIDIDTVNAEMLRLTKTDTLQAITRSYYHAQ